MTTSLGSRKQLDDFEGMMTEELCALVHAQDCEKGIEMLVSTLKKQHVNNFAI